MAKQYVASYDPFGIVDREVEYIFETPEGHSYIWDDDDEISAFISEKGYDNFKANLEEAGLLNSAEKVAWDDANGNADIFAFAWEDAHEGISEWMKASLPNTHAPDFWFAQGRNMGWRQRSGFALIKAKDGKEFLRGILPDTDVTFEAYTSENNPNALNMKVSHHDAPMGESYTVTPWIREILDLFVGDVWQEVTDRQSRDNGVEVMISGTSARIILYPEGGHSADLEDPEGAFNGKSFYDLLSDAAVRKEIADAILKGEERVAIEFPAFEVEISTLGEKGSAYMDILVDFDY